MIKSVYVLFLVAVSNNLFVYSEVNFESSLEDLHFKYSEHDIDRYIQEARETEKMRINNAFENVTGKGLREGLCPYFANFYLGKDLDLTNQTLLGLLTTEDTHVQEKYRLNDPWCLATNQLLYHMYYTFGSKGKLFPGRLYPKTEKAVLDFLWNRMKYKNDIHLTRKSTWWMIGSENHDLVAKVSSLISSQIFMNEPEYKDRVYPDLGTGGGEKYWFHHMYGKGRVEGPHGRANYKDGNKYTAAAHYKEWVKYFDEYFSERAKRGFFLEVASHGYMGVTVSYLTDIFDLCDDRRLTEKAEMFLDAVWADWAQDQINGVRGGSKTRSKGGMPSRWNDAMCRMARFYFGGQGNAQTHFFAQLLSSYELKPILWHIALDRQGLGEFAFVSRKPGEEENVWPRPLGAERTMLCDTESRFVRYSWITPDYILGCQMDHPAAVHSHLSNQTRWQGVTFKGKNGPRIFPTALKQDKNGKWNTNDNGYCRAVQDKNVMIVQQARRWFQMNPDWFPAKDIVGQEYGVFFSDDLDKVVEKDGWIFIEHGNAYLAVRVLVGEYSQGWTILVDDATSGLTSQILKDSYRWKSNRSLIHSKDKYAGMIFEASRKAHHKTLEDFIEDILDNPLVLEKTVVPGWHRLRYRGCGRDAKEIYFNLANNEIPTVGGQRIDYSPEMLFDSPYLKSKYKSGIITISKDDKKIVLDFNK